VIVQLIDSATGRHIQSRTFNHPRENYFEVRDEVTSLTVSSLRVALPADIQAKSSASVHVPEYDAYLLYRRGMDELNTPNTVTTLNTALDWMEAALEVDPEYAAAYAGQCRTHVLLFQETNDPANISAAREACASALSRNPNLDIVHEAMGDLHFRLGEIDEAEASYVEALRINPKSADTMRALANVYRLQQRPEQAEGMLRNALGLRPGDWKAYESVAYFYFMRGDYSAAAVHYEAVVSLDEDNESGLAGLGASLMLAGDFEKAAPIFSRSIDLRPHAPTYNNLGLMHYYLGNYDEAIDAIRQGLGMSPDDHLMWSSLGDVMTAAGRKEEATAAYSHAEELVRMELGVNPNDPGLLMDVAWIKAMLGDEEAARRSIGRAKEITPDDPYTSYYEGLILARYGDDQAALDALERAVANGYSTTIVRAEPLLASLRDYPRFEALTSAN
jgi:tetratricopeptide (TPR) repeat protein